MIVGGPLCNRRKAIDEAELNVKTNAILLCYKYDPPAPSYA